MQISNLKNDKAKMKPNFVEEISNYVQNAGSYNERNQQQVDRCFGSQIAYLIGLKIYKQNEYYFNKAAYFD